MAGGHGDRYRSTPTRNTYTCQWLPVSSAGDDNVQPENIDQQTTQTASSVGELLYPEHIQDTRMTLRNDL